MKPMTHTQIKEVAVKLNELASDTERAHTLANGRWPTHLQPEDRAAKAEVDKLRDMALALNTHAEVLEKSPIDALKAAIHALVNALHLENPEGLQFSARGVVAEAELLIWDELPSRTAPTKLSGGPR